MLYGARQRIWEQAENRRHAQKALLELLVAGGRERDAVDAPGGRAGRSAATSSSSRSSRWPTAARASRAWARAATSCSSPARSPATACAPSCTSASAATRTRARSRCCEPSPERIAPRAEHPGVPWQVLPYERQLRSSSAQVDEALRRIGGLDGFELRGDRARAASSGATATSSSTPSARTSTASWCAASTPPAGAHRVAPMSDCLLASERGNRARELAAGVVSRRRACARGIAARPGGARAPRRARRQAHRRRRPTGARACATWSCAKAGAPGSCRCGS